MDARVGPAPRPVGKLHAAFATVPRRGSHRPLLIMWQTVGQRARACARARVWPPQPLGREWWSGTWASQAVVRVRQRRRIDGLLPHGRVRASLQPRQHDALSRPLHQADRQQPRRHEPRLHAPRLRQRCLPLASLFPRRICQSECVDVGARTYVCRRRPGVWGYTYVAGAYVCVLGTSSRYDARYVCVLGTSIRYDARMRHACISSA